MNKKDKAIYDYIQKALTPFSRIKLKVNARDITLVMEYDSIKLKYDIVVYIGGQISFKNDAKEENRLFWCMKTKGLYSAKAIAEHEKANGKRWSKRNFPEIYKKYTYYIPYFSTFGSLRSQWSKRKLEIEIVEE